jgi:hypothetical protein
MLCTTQGGRAWIFGTQTMLITDCHAYQVAKQRLSEQRAQHRAIMLPTTPLLWLQRIPPCTGPPAPIQRCTDSNSAYVRHVNA